MACRRALSSTNSVRRLALYRRGAIDQVASAHRMRIVMVASALGRSARAAISRLLHAPPCVMMY